MRTLSRITTFARYITVDGCLKFVVYAAIVAAVLFLAELIADGVKDKYVDERVPPPALIEKDAKDALKNVLEKELRVENKIWIFRASDDNRFEIRRYRKHNKSIFVYVHILCMKPSMPKHCLTGLIRLEYDETGKFIRLDNSDAKVWETLE